MGAEGVDTGVVGRALEFVFGLLEKVTEGQEANKAAREAYDQTLSRHHNFMVRKTFQVGMMAAPSTATMLRSLGDDPTSVQVCLAAVQRGRRR